MKKFKIIPIFVPHRGCPHRCAFCDQRQITGSAADMTAEKAGERIDRALAALDAERYHIEVAFYGGSFTAIDRESQDALLNAALERKKRGEVHGIRLSTRPDYIDRAILDNLKDKGVTEIELGAQSMCDDVLERNGRGHTARQTATAAALIRRYGFTLGLQMMVGLMGDTEEKSLYTARKIAELSPDFVRVYPTLVLRHTALYDAYVRGAYTPLTVARAVEVCASVLRIFNPRGIRVIRLGLLLSGSEARENFVAGPYHPRFRELAEQRAAELAAGQVE